MPTKPGFYEAAKSASANQTTSLDPSVLGIGIVLRRNLPIETVNNPDDPFSDILNRLADAESRK